MAKKPENMSHYHPFTLVLRRLCLMLILISMIGCGGAKPDNKTEGDEFIVGDTEGSAELRFEMAKEKKYLFYVCAQSHGGGSIEQLGTYKAISYLTSKGYKEFQDQYDGEQSACPAGFLNNRTKSARLSAVDPKVIEKLNKIDFSGKKYGVKFRVKARSLKFLKGVARDGSPLVPNFAGTGNYLVTEILESP